MSATAKEVAERAGVSISTVSRTLNDKPGISAQTRQRVLEAARELRYVPHAAARGLATVRMHNVGFVYRRLPPRLEADFYTRIMSGVEEELGHRGYHTILAALDLPESPCDLRVILDSRVDGLILVGPQFSPRSICELKSAGLPVVLVDHTLNETPVDSILCDNSDGAYRATRHLIEHRHKDVVLLCGPEAWVSMRERRAGYQRAMAEAGLEPRIAHMRASTLDTGYEAMRQVLRINPCPTAVCAANDATAIGAIRALRGAGRRVPEDVAVTGFDDICWAGLNDPPLTTVRIFLEEMGRFAAQRLVELIEGRHPVPIVVSFTTELVIRRSCGCPSGTPG
jgi:LacI family transcriptional regulator